MPLHWKTRSRKNHGITRKYVSRNPTSWEKRRIESSLELRPTSNGTLQTATPNNLARKDRENVIPSHQLKKNCGR